MARLKARLLGLALLGGSGLSTLAHRAVYEAARQGPTQAAEFGLSLLTFLLASTGVLLLIHADSLFGRMDVDPRDRPARHPAGQTPPPSHRARRNAGDSCRPVRADTASATATNDTVKCDEP